MSSVRMTVVPSGPVFNGILSRAVNVAAATAEETVGQVGVNLVQQRLGGVLKNPTGFFVSHIQSNRVAKDVIVSVAWPAVLYGPWLEGVESRNTSSRFKGYHTFRLTQQALAQQAATIAEPVVAAAVKVAK